MQASSEDTQQVLTWGGRGVEGDLLIPAPGPGRVWGMETQSLWLELGAWEALFLHPEAWLIGPVLGSRRQEVYGGSGTCVCGIWTHTAMLSESKVFVCLFLASLAQGRMRLAATGCPQWAGPGSLPSPDEARHFGSVLISPLGTLMVHGKGWLPMLDGPVWEQSEAAATPRGKTFHYRIIMLQNVPNKSSQANE